MNENIDLTKILKDCPKGWKFYSSVYGEVAFIEVLDNASDIQRLKYPIKLLDNSGECYYVSSKGRHRYNLGECTLFPSREQRDWSKFTAPWHKKDKFDPKALQPFDKVLAMDAEYATWRATFFSHKNEGCIREYVTSDNSYICCIPYNDETKHLVGTSDEAPEYYRYWED